MYEDNQGFISLAKDPVFHSRTKHIDIKFHFLREKVEEGIIELEYMPTDQMVADGLTKYSGESSTQTFYTVFILNHKQFQDIKRASREGVDLK